MVVFSEILPLLSQELLGLDLYLENLIKLWPHFFHVILNQGTS